MFSGNYDYKVDEKGRVPVPPKFRQELKGEVYLGPGEEKCIRVYPSTEFERIGESLSTRPVPPADIRKLQRALMSNYFRAEVDGQGRVALPAKLRADAGITDAAIVAGMGKGFEIWNPDLWSAENAKVREEAWQLVETFGTPEK